MSMPSATFCGLAERRAAAGHQRVRLELRQTIERRRPIGEMRVAAIAGRVIFDEIAGEHDIGVRHIGDHIARRVAAAEMHDAHLALAEPHRHLFRKRDGRPGQPREWIRPRGNSRGKRPISESMSCCPRSTIRSRVASDARISASAIGRRAEHAHRVIMREQHIFDRLVGDLAHALDHVDAPSPASPARRPPSRRRRRR